MTIDYSNPHNSGNSKLQIRLFRYRFGDFGEFPLPNFSFFFILFSIRPTSRLPSNILYDSANYKLCSISRSARTTMHVGRIKILNTWKDTYGVDLSYG